MIEKKCVKCGEVIPRFIIVNNEKKSLQKRKYCIRCSPYKQHNTKKIHIRERSVIINGKKKCSQCKQIKKISEFYYIKDRKIGSCYCKVCLSKKLCSTILEKKLKAIEYKGGQCIRCGYKKYYGALQFHHRDPNIKEMSITKARYRKWETFKKELDKCDLLCANCHAEIHAENNMGT